MHHRIVQRRVKLLSQALDLRHAQLFHRTVELVHDHLDALAVGLVLGSLLQGPFEVVVNRQELRQRIRLDIVVQGFPFLLAAPAEVVVFRADPQVPVVQLGVFLLQLFDLFFLCRGLAEAVFLLLAAVFGVLGILRLGVLLRALLCGRLFGLLRRRFGFRCLCLFFFAGGLFRSGLCFLLRQVRLLFFVHSSLSSLFLIISLLCRPSGGASPLPSLRESPAARKRSLDATAE